MQRKKREKQKNALGIAYEDADQINKILFTRTLDNASQHSGKQYMTRFRQTWQYVSDLESIPWVIVNAAIEHIGYVPAVSVGNNETKMQTNEAI